jgi:hypothetical protein
MVSLLLIGCLSPDAAPAPPTLDEFLHAAWTDYASVDLAAIAELTTTFSPTLEPADFPLQGDYSDLTDGEFALVDVEWDADPADASGFYLVDTLDCSSDELVVALTNPHQDEVFPDNYTAYQRDFTGDLDAFLAGDTDVLTWDTTYSVDIPIAGAYTTFVHGGALRLDLDGEEGYATRTWAPNPADSVEESTRLDQDYQIEVYFPGDGGMIHAYGMWRQFQLNPETTQDSDIIRALILDGMKVYFDDTSTFCAGLRAG